MPIEIKTQYVWIAVYSDGTGLQEYEEAPDGAVIQHYFKDIDLDKCTEFILHSVFPERCKDVVIKLTSGQRLIFVRRYSGNLNFQEMSFNWEEHPVHVVGWQETVFHKNISVYLYVFSDGSSLLSNNFQAV